LDSPSLGHQPLYIFNFFNISLNFQSLFKVLIRLIFKKTFILPSFSEDGLYRNLSSYLLAHFYLMKKSAKLMCKLSSASVWETPNRPPNMIKCIVPAFFGDRFVEKECGLLTHNPPAEEVGGLGICLYLAAQNFVPG
jgi:hypothetical protein